MTQHQDEVPIHIDNTPYKSPTPTTGAALFALAHVPADLVLFRQRHGGEEDEPIDNGPEVVSLKNGDHFRSGQPKTYTIYVNGQQKTVPAKTLTFVEVVALAFDNPPTGDNILFTISYEDGPPANPQGSLREGGTVKLKNGMIFNVTATDKS